MKESRRKFLKKGVKAVAGGIIVLLIPKSFKAESYPTVKRQKTKDWMERYYSYVIDIRKCIGCGNCVKSCKRENGVLEPFFRTWVERYLAYEDGYVQVESPKGGYNGFSTESGNKKVTKGFFVPKLCNHCRKTPCIQVCPVNASYASPEGVVLVDKKQCIGCGYCVQACPYGSRYIDPRTHTADKCTWCYHRITKGLKPACVVSCPTGTRRFGNLKDENSDIKEIIESQQVAVLKQELHTEPFCFYLGYDRVIR